MVFYEDADYRLMIQDRYTCTEKAAFAAKNGNIFPLSSYVTISATDVQSNEHKPSDMNRVAGLEEGEAISQASLGFTGNRPRWYYFFLMNCKSGGCDDSRGWCQGPIDVEYTLLLTNGVGYLKHFSADEIGILPTAITFGTFYLLLTLFALIYIVKPLRGLHKLHYTVVLYAASLVCYTVSMWFDTADLTQEGNFGTRCESCQMVALSLRVCSDSMTLLTAILLAKGWTVVRRKISAKGRVKIAMFMTTYFIAGVFSVGGQFTDNSDTLFRTPTDRLLDWGWYTFVVRLFAFVWFTYAIYTTTKYDSYGRFRFFFRFLYCSMGPWILALPISMLCALSMETYYRARWVYAMELGSAFAGHLVLTVMFRPSKYNVMFPFAFRTAAMEAQDRWVENKKAQAENGGEKSGSGVSSSVQMSRLPRDNTPSITNGQSVAETSYGLTNMSGAIVHKQDANSVSSDVRRRRPSANRSNISGGMAVDAPISRVQNLATSLRKKLGVVYEVADQLEEELQHLDVNDEEEENGALMMQTEKS